VAGFEPATSTCASRVINPGRHLGSPGAHQVGGALSTELHGTGKGRASRNKPNVPPAPRDRLSDPSRQSVKRRPCRFHGLFQGFTRYRPTVSALRPVGDSNAARTFRGDRARAAADATELPCRTARQRRPADLPVTPGCVVGTRPVAPITIGEPGRGQDLHLGLRLRKTGVRAAGPTPPCPEISAVQVRYLRALPPGDCCSADLG